MTARTEAPLTPHAPPLTVVIVGRPNVGKSTLFNRLLGRRRALVHDAPGVTRDRIVETGTWLWKGRKIPVRLIDTGGLGHKTFQTEIARQVEIAVTEADALLVTFDGQAGLIPDDLDMLRGLRRQSRLKEIPVIGVVNKADVDQHESMVADFYTTKLASIVAVSAEHGRAIDDLKAAVLEPLEARLPELQSHEDEPDPDVAVEAEDLERPDRIPRIAVVGKPNVGKSTLINTLLGEERMIASPIAGTTVDAVDSAITLAGKPFVLVDTAGVRRKSKTEKGIEVLSVVQMKKALERSDVALLMIDSIEGPTDQDEKIASLIEEAGCSVVIVISKWDLQRANKDFNREAAAKQVRSRMRFLGYAPVMFLSAKTKKGLEDLPELMETVLEQRTLKIPTKEFTEWARSFTDRTNPHGAKFYMCHQAGRHPPTFVFHVNDPHKVHFSLRRQMANAIRERWGYMGTPIRILILKSKSGRQRKKR